MVTGRQCGVVDSPRPPHWRAPPLPNGEEEAHAWDRGRAGRRMPLEGAPESGWGAPYSLLHTQRLTRQPPRGIASHTAKGGHEATSHPGLSRNARPALSREAEYPRPKAVLTPGLNPHPAPHHGHVDAILTPAFARYTHSGRVFCSLLTKCSWGNPRVLLHTQAPLELHPAFRVAGAPRPHPPTPYPHLTLSKS